MSTMGVNAVSAPRLPDTVSPVLRTAPTTQQEPPAPFTLGRTDPMRALLRPGGPQPGGGDILQALAHRPAAIRKMYGSLSGRDNDNEVTDGASELSAHLAEGGTLESFAAAKQLDAAQVFLLGLYARSSNQGRKDPRLSRQLDEFADTHASALHAAVNTASALGVLGTGQTDRAWMRALYQSAIMETATLQDVFESLLARFGVDRFEGGARAMLKAFSDDLASPNASTGADRLQAVLMHSMVTVRNILGVIHTGGAFVQKHGRQLPRPTKSASPAPAEEAKPESSDANADTGDKPQDDLAEDAMTAQLVKLLLQLCVSSAAVKLVPPFLGSQGVHSTEEITHLRRLHSEFILLIDKLPESLWKQRAHKDQLIRALRQQWTVELMARSV